MKRLYLICEEDAKTVQIAANRLYDRTSMSHKGRCDLAHTLTEVLSNLSVVRIPDPIGETEDANTTP